MIIFTKTSFFTHVLYHPHISAIYKMLNPIIKITSELAHVSVGGKAADSWKAPPELVAGAEPGREGGAAGQYLAPVGTGQVHDGEKAKNVHRESVSGYSWREFVR